MEKLIYKTGYAFLVMLCILALGMFIPAFIATIVAFFTEETFANIISTSVLFWLFSIIGCVISFYFINEIVMEDGEEY